MPSLPQRLGAESDEMPFNGPLHKDGEMPKFRAVVSPVGHSVSDGISLNYLTAFFSASALSVRSHVRASRSSVLPKWP